MTLTTERLKWLHDAATELSATKLKMTMRPDELLVLTSELLANREAQPVGYIDPDSLKEYRGQRAGGTWSAVQRTTSGLNMTTPIYTARCAPTLPDGFKLVPTVPTPEMIAAAMNCDDVTFINLEDFCVNFGNIYAAMLEAAPEGGNG